MTKIAFLDSLLYSSAGSSFMHTSASEVLGAVESAWSTGGT